jgi:hypothetical protein|tara:strand:+ start:3165 stop:3998 length:834 start_codon:yes stop_codon:yes gene_type:complete
MIKFKHNKKRNSAFLYEVLVQELTKSIINKDLELKEKLTQAIKESFSKESMMYRELKLYRAISRSKGIKVHIAEKIINEVKSRHKEIDKKQLVSEQNKLVRKIKKMMSDDAFSNFVPNYKDLASISQIFNQRISVKSKVLLENEIIKNMTEQDQMNEMVPMDNLVFKSFAQRFNNEYGDKLLPEQKTLLNKFITSFYNNGIELSTYLNEEVGRLKSSLKSSLDNPEFVDDEDMHNNAKNVIGLLESYKNKAPDQKMVEEVIKIQELVQEINNHVNQD